MCWCPIRHTFFYSLPPCRPYVNNQHALCDARCPPHSLSVSARRELSCLSMGISESAYSKADTSSSSCAKEFRENMFIQNARTPIYTQPFLSFLSRRRICKSGPIAEFLQNIQTPSGTMLWSEKIQQLWWVLRWNRNLGILELEILVSHTAEAWSRLYIILLIEWHHERQRWLKLKILRAMPRNILLLAPLTLFLLFFTFCILLRELAEAVS